MQGLVCVNGLNTGSPCAHWITRDHHGQRGHCNIWLESKHARYNIFDKSNVEYTIMTNQIFNKIEVEIWKKNPPTCQFFKTSLRIDDLILDHEYCYSFIKKYNYSPSIDGIKDYIRDWYHKINPEYFMASLPYDFKYDKYHSNFGIDNILIPLAQELNLSSIS